MNRAELHDRLVKLNEHELLAKTKLSDSKFASNDYYHVETEWIPSNIFFKKHGRFVTVNSHKHNWIEMSYIYSGEIRETINGTSLVLREGDLIILDTNVIHSIDVAMDNDIMLNFAIGPDYFKKSLLYELNSENSISEFLIQSIYEKQKYNSFLLFHTKGNEDIFNIICKMAKESMESQLASEDILDNCLKLLFWELARIYKEETTDKGSRFPKQNIALQIMQYIESEYKTATLVSTAEHFKYNPNYFSHLIKKITGKNFQDIIIHKKLNHSAALLRNSNMSIEEICDEINWGNRSQFYKMFKEKYGFTPKKYRD